MGGEVSGWGGGEVSGWGGKWVGSKWALGWWVRK